MYFVKINIYRHHLLIVYLLQMSGKWNPGNENGHEKAMEYFYSLPDSDSDSSVEADIGAVEDLANLTGNNLEASVSFTNNETLDQQQCELQPPTNMSVEISDEGDTSDHNEDEWESATDFFSNVQPSAIQEGKPKINFDATSKEVDFFETVFDHDIIEIIVTETNIYAKQKGCTDWEDTNSEELKAFIGCFILMGIHQLPHLQNYWSSDPYLGVASISQVMPAKRFKKLIENVHCNNNENILPHNHAKHDKLHKIRPIICKLKENCDKCYTSSSFVSVDESMIPFKGRSSLKQYMPLKPVKRGYKVWCLADAKTGYIMNFDIYTGKNHCPHSTEDTLGERVVIKLVENMHNSNNTVTFDNFFTTIKLLKMLLNIGIYACGTVRTNRKGLPSMLKSKDKLQRGEFMYETKGKISAVKWMDRKPVTMLSTAHDPRKTTTVLRKNKDGTRVDVPCPVVVAEYNSSMGGVDRFDQMRECYAIGRRSVKWWHRIFYFLIDLAIINSFVLWKLNKGCEKEEQLSYRIRLARQLIAGFTSRKRRGRPASFLGKRGCVPEDVRLVKVGNHLPVKNTNYRRCRMCSTKSNEKRTKFVCTACDVPLCVDPCFRKFHGK